MSYPPELRAEHLATHLRRARAALLPAPAPPGAGLASSCTSSPRSSTAGRAPGRATSRRLYALLEPYGEERLIQAVQAAALRGLFGAEYVKDFVAEEVA